MLLNYLRNRLQIDIGLWGLGYLASRLSPKMLLVNGEWRRRGIVIRLFLYQKARLLRLSFVLIFCHDGCLGVDASNDRCDMVILT